MPAFGQTRAEQMHSQSPSMGCSLGLSRGHKERLSSSGKDKKCTTEARGQHKPASVWPGLLPAWNRWRSKKPRKDEEGITGMVAVWRMSNKTIFLQKLLNLALVSWNICYNCFVAMTNSTNNSKTVRNTDTAKAASVHQWPSSPHQ